MKRKIIPFLQKRFQFKIAFLNQFSKLKGEGGHLLLLWLSHLCSKLFCSGPDFPPQSMQVHSFLEEFWKPVENMFCLRCLCQNPLARSKCELSGRVRLSQIHKLSSSQCNSKVWVPSTCSCNCPRWISCSTGYLFDSHNSCQCVPTHLNVGF